MKYRTIGEVCLELNGYVKDNYWPEVMKYTAEEYIEEHKDEMLVVLRLYPAVSQNRFTFTPTIKEMMEKRRSVSVYGDKVLMPKPEVTMGFYSGIDGVIRELVKIIRKESIEMENPLIFSDSDGITPLYLGKRYGNIEGVQYLVDMFKTIGEVIDHIEG